MNLKFWKRNNTSHPQRKNRLQGPRELSDRVGIHLISRLKEDPDWVWTLKSVSRPRENNQQIHDIRLYDPREAAAGQIKVENYTSLDSHRNLILFSGLVNRDTGMVELEKTSQIAA